MGCYTQSGNTPDVLKLYIIFLRDATLKGAVHFILAILSAARIISGQRPNSLVVKHVLGKDESQVRFLLRAPE